ncbi:MAG: hypothetical protein IJT11_05595 [Bacteroidaceae bacterium]|nr:hypothetical protein [Bacteroidaceae bacterium]
MNLDLINDIGLTNNVVICSHVNPDGDAIGSSLALKLYLERKGKQATVVVPNAFPDFLKWLPGADSILIHTKQPDQVKAALDAADLVIVCDLNQPMRLGGMEDVVMASTRLASSSTTISTPTPTSARSSFPSRRCAPRAKSSATCSASKASSTTSRQTKQPASTAP